MEVLLESKDGSAQKHCARVIKYLLCKMKMIEKDDIRNDTREKYTETITGTDDGVDRTEEKERPKALSLRFMNLMVGYLPDRAAKNWKTFDHYLEVILAFAIHAPEELETDPSPQEGLTWNKDSEAYQIGMELYFKKNMLEYLGDWVLGEASPLQAENPKQRIQMGGSYIKANFSAVTKLMTIMMSDQAMSAKYPFSANAQKIIQHKEILAKMMEPDGGEDYSAILSDMCKDNLPLSKKMAKVYIKGINKQYDQLDNTLKNLANFLRVDDSLKLIKLEWIFGVP